MEIAAEKLLSKYTTAFEGKDKTISGGSYLKYALIHKALGYKNNPKEYINFINLPDGTIDINQRIKEVEYEIEKDENGMAKLGEKTEDYTGFRSFIDLIKSYKYKENELTCGSLSDFKYNRLKASEDEKFTQTGHAYNVVKINSEGVVTSNPYYAGFPHVMNRRLFLNDFFQQILYLPQENIIRVKDLSD